MSKLTQIMDGALRQVLGNMNFTKGVLAINLGGAATVKTTAALIYTVGGLLLTKAALSAQSFAVTHGPRGEPVASGIAAYVQPINTTVVYLVALDATGTVAIVQGSYAGQTLSYPADLSKNLLGSGGPPEEPTGYTTIGSVKVVTNGVTTFTPGTTALDAAGLTVTFSDISIVPPTL